MIGVKSFFLYILSIGSSISEMLKKQHQLCITQSGRITVFSNEYQPYE